MPTPEQELAKAKEEYEKAKAQAKARYDQARARHATNARKLDTRRKIVAGGALFELATRDPQAEAVLERILGNIGREVDRKAFEGWERPKPGDGRKDAKADVGKTEPAPEEDTPSPADESGVEAARTAVEAVREIDDTPMGRSLFGESDSPRS